MKINKNDLKAFTIGAGITCISCISSKSLGMDINAPITCLTGGLISLGIFKGVSYKMLFQTEFNKGFSFIRFLTEKGLKIKNSLINKSKDETTRYNSFIDYLISENFIPTAISLELILIVVNFIIKHINVNFDLPLNGLNTLLTWIFAIIGYFIPELYKTFPEMIYFRIHTPNLHIPFSFYIMALLAVIPLTYVSNFIFNIKAINKAQMKAESIYKDKVNIIELSEDKAIINSKKVLDEKDNSNLQLILNGQISEITQGISNKSRYTISFKKNTQTNYQRLPKASIQRLEQILINMKAQPVLKGEPIKTANSTKYKFTLNINHNRIKRELKNIAVKLGVDDTELFLTAEDGFYYFEIVNPDNRIYYLDKIIAENEKPKNMLLPFIIGSDIKTGEPLILDLTKLPHLVIAGVTMTGKSVTLNGIIDSLLYWNYNNVVVFCTDYKESTLLKYQNLSNCHFIEKDEKSQVEFYLQILKVFEDRLKLFRQVTETQEDINCTDIKTYNATQKDKLPYLIITVEEANTIKEDYSNFILNGEKVDTKKLDSYLRDLEDNKRFIGIRDMKKKLLNKGRSLGIHVIDSVQRVTDESYPIEWRGNIPVHLSHKLTEKSQIEKLFNKEDKNFINQIIKLKRGIFYYQDSEINYQSFLKGSFIDDKHNKVFKAIEKCSYKANRAIKENELQVKRLAKTKESKQEKRTDEKRQSNNS